MAAHAKPQPDHAEIVLRFLLTSARALLLAQVAAGQGNA